MAGKAKTCTVEEMRRILEGLVREQEERIRKELLQQYDRKAARFQDRIEDFEEASGVSLFLPWPAGMIGEAVRLVLQEGVPAMKSRLIRLAGELRETAAEIEEAFGEADSEDSDGSDASDSSDRSEEGGGAGVCEMAGVAGGGLGTEGPVESAAGGGG